MSKSSKDNNGTSGEKISKNKKSNYSSPFEKKQSQDCQTKDRVKEYSESVKSFSGRQTKKGSLESLMKSKTFSDSMCNIDDMSSEELHDSVLRIKNNPTEPFKFLSHILDPVDVDDHRSLGRTKPTDIDLQLASLLKRVEMNKFLLERTNQRVKDINFIVEKNEILSSRELNNNKDYSTRMEDYVENNAELSIEHPGIDELQRTMKNTMQMLECIKKVTSGDAVSEDLSSEFYSKMELESKFCNSKNNQLKSVSNLKIESE